MFLGEGRHLVLRLLAAQGVVVAGVDQQAVFFGIRQRRLLPLTGGGRLARAARQNDDADFEAVFFGKLKVALVMRRAPT